MLSASGFAFTVGFQGMSYDAASGTYHADRREYSPTLGRWVTTDPLLYQAGDGNFYRFVGNNPGNRTDPSGLADDSLVYKGRPGGADDLPPGFRQSQSESDRAFLRWATGTKGVEFKNPLPESDRAFLRWAAGGTRDYLSYYTDDLPGGPGWVGAAPVLGPLWDAKAAAADGRVGRVFVDVGLALLDLTGIMALGRGVARGLARESLSNTPRFIGNARVVPAGTTALTDISVTRQLSPNTCVPSSLDMLLEYHAPGRRWTNIEGIRGSLKTEGMLPADAAIFASDNLEAIGMRMVRSDLPDAIASGQPFMAWVHEGEGGHALLVQGVRNIDGVPHVVVRDPARGAYLERLVDFDARVVRDPKIVGQPTIRGSR